MKAGVKYSVTEEQLNNMIQSYQENGGEVIIFDDGCLRTGTVIFDNRCNRKLWNFVAYEYALNEWSSDEIMIKYRELPKKWLKRLDEFNKESA